MKIRTLNKKRNRDIHEYKKMGRKNPDWRYKGFISHDVLGYCDIVDLYFIGKFKSQRVMFNTTLATLREEFQSKVQEQVYDEIEKLYPGYLSSSTANFFRGKDEPDKRDPRYIDPELIQQIEAKDEELRLKFINDGSIKVAEHVEIEPDYSFGIGLTVVLDCKDCFTEQDVRDAITRVQQLELIEYNKPIILGEARSFTQAELEGISCMSPINI